MSEARLAETGTNGRDSDELTARQRKALPFLVSASSRERGCKAAGIGRSTLTEWLKEPAFTRALEDAEAMAFREALGRVQRLTDSAAGALEALLGSDTESIRLRAAAEVLGTSMKAREEITLEERLMALEARIEEVGRAPARLRP